MPTAPIPAHPLAVRLLDAQVAWVLADLTDRYPELVGNLVDELLDVAADVPVAELTDRDAVRSVLRRIVHEAGESSVLEDLVGVLADAVHGLPASDEHRLGDVVSRESVEALVAALLRMHDLQDRLMERMAQSPTVGQIASAFATRMVTDFVEQNRARAEKIPGMSSVFALGTSAASKVRSATDRHLEQFIGDAAGRGAQFAIRRTNSAARELLRDAPVQQAAMEVWDLHADEPIGSLRDYLSADELRELALLVRQLVAEARDSAWAGQLLDACVEAFFDRYGEWDLAALLAELGVDREALSADLLSLTAPLLARLRADGTLESVIRDRLAPFWSSAEVETLLPPD